MPRDVNTIEEEDKNKLELGADDALVDIEIDTTGEVAKTKSELSPDEVAADLRKQIAERDATLAVERRKREEAEARAGRADGAASDARATQVAAQERAIKDRVAAAKTKLESVKQQLKQAKASQDDDAEVELSDAMAEARYELNAAAWEEGQFAKWKETQAQAPQRTTQTNNSPYTEAEQAWIEEHPEFYSNKKFARLTKVLAAEALEEGHKQDSRAFFNFVENGLRENGFLTKDPTSETNEMVDARASTSTSTATPPNRTGNGNASPPRTGGKYPFLPKGFTVPRDWVQAAQDQGFDDPLEYANMRLEIEANEKGRQ